MEWVLAKDLTTTNSTQRLVNKRSLTTYRKRKLYYELRNKKGSVYVRTRQDVSKSKNRIRKKTIYIDLSCGK